ncbi:MAG: ABC transporter ATP-binding protein [Propionibacteriaceae bacterium]|jgi:putative ABC transport system ATP-binding protein|nr:ABC transporter ATP-binding protein [Propionibacteriaceae bacterium]
MAEVALCAEGLAFSLRLPTGTLELLRGVNLKVERGESVAVTGRSGSGKTTLLTLLGLMAAPDEGELVIGNTAVTGLSDDRAARFRNDFIGFVFQNYSLVPHLSVIDNVLLPFTYGKRVPGKAARKAAAQALERVELSQLADTRPAKLSGGEQQRVAIARALVRNPAIILADEPTGALDVGTGDRIIEVLRQAAIEAAKCLIVVTHDPDVAERMDSRYELRDGRLGAAREPAASRPRRMLESFPRPTAGDESSTARVALPGWGAVESGHLVLLADEGE